MRNTPDRRALRSPAQVRFARRASEVKVLSRTLARVNADELTLNTQLGLPLSLPVHGLRASRSLQCTRPLFGGGGGRLPLVRHSLWHTESCASRIELTSGRPVDEQRAPIAQLSGPVRGEDVTAKGWRETHRRPDPAGLRTGAGTARRRSSFPYFAINPKLHLRSQALRVSAV